MKAAVLEEVGDIPHYVDLHRRGEGARSVVVFE